MGKRDDKKPTDKQAELSKLQAEEAEHRERAGKLLEEKKGLQAKLFEADRKSEQDVKSVLDGFPAGPTSELVAKVLELRDPGRTEKKEAIERLGLAVDMENKKATECRMKGKAVEAEILEVERDEQAVEIHVGVLKFIELFKQVNGQRLKLFSLCGGADFRDFAARMQRLNLKGGLVVGALAESYLCKPERQDECTVNRLAEALVDLGKCYACSLLTLPGQPNVNEPMPLMRDNFIPRKWQVR